MPAPTSKYDIQVEVETQYLADRSDPAQNHYVFAYTITIYNVGSMGAQLLSRRWIINDANGTTEQVQGDGVVGETPYIEPGEFFRYTSGTHIETPVGSMCGSYLMVADDAVEFNAEIPEFVLSAAPALH